MSDAAKKIEKEETEEIFENLKYICDSTSLIVESLKRGLDIAQLPTGDIIVTEVKTVNTLYSWDKNKNKLVKINSSLLVFDLVAMPLIGIFVERFKPSNVMIVAATILGVTLPIFWYFLENCSFYYALFVRTWIVFWGVMFACPFNLWCFNQTNKKDKYIVVGIASAFGSGLIGKMNPAIGLLIYHQFGNHHYISAYIAAIMLATAYIIYKNEQPKLQHHT